MIGATKRVAICAALLALGGLTVACGDDDGDGTGTDAGRPDGGPRDAGPQADVGPPPADSGPGDSGPVDAGPPPPNVRLAHLISNGPPVHVCINAVGAATARLITVNSMTGAATPVPYRGVSAYTDALTLPMIDHNVRVYTATDIAGTDCPAPAATTPAPLFAQEINIADLTGGAYYTVAAIGLAGQTGARAPQLAIIEDDLTAPDAGEANIRLVHALVNLPVNVDVCYDPDFMIVGGVPMPGATAAVPLFSNAAFIGTDPATTDVRTGLDYIGVPPVTGGYIFVYPRGATATDCATASPATPGTLAIPVPVPVPPAGTPNVPPALSAGATFDAGEIVSIFAVGNAAFATMGAPTACTMDSQCTTAVPSGHVCNPVAGVCVHPQGPTVLPYVDNWTP